MSSIGSPDTSLHRTGLESLNGQVSLDELRRGDQGIGPLAPESLHGPEPIRDLPATDPGEDMLNAAAWDGVTAGQRLLAGDHGLASQLGTMELSSAADSATDAILSTLA